MNRNEGPAAGSLAPDEGALQQAPPGVELQRSSLRRNRDYLWWFAGDSAGHLATAMRTLALSYLAFHLTGRISSSGILGTTVAVTTIVVAIFGGAIVDRMDRRRAMVCYGIGGMVIWGSGALLLLLGAMTFPLLLAVAFGSAVLGGIFGEATNAALRSIVSTRDYPVAQAANQGRDGAISVIGAPLGGALYTLRDWLPFVAPVICFALLAFSALRIKTDLYPRRGLVRGSSGVLRDIAEGFRYVIEHKRLLRVLVMMVFINLGFSGLMTGMVLNLVNIGTSPVKVGLINTAVGISAILGSVVATKLVDRIPTGLLLVSISVIGVVVLSPLLADQGYWTVLVTESIVMFLVPAVNAGIVGYAFALIPVELQGRVGSVTNLANIFAAFSAAIGGWLLTVSSPAVCAAAFWSCVVIAALFVSSSKLLREIPTPERWPEFPL
ncbi:MFS transporter [Actinomycetaceae bacterium L2_0104]